MTLLTTCPSIFVSEYAFSNNALSGDSEKSKSRQPSKKRKDKNERPNSISGLKYAYAFYDLYDYLNCEMEHEYFNGMVQVNRRHWKNNYDYITIKFAYRNSFIHYKKNLLISLNTLSVSENTYKRSIFYHKKSSYSNSRMMIMTNIFIHYSSHPFVLCSHSKSVVYCFHNLLIINTCLTKYPT